MKNFEQASPPEAETPGISGNYWADKGNPKEQFDITFVGRKIEVANFSDVELAPVQLKELQEVIAEFSKIKDGKAFDKIKSIFIDNNQPVDPETGKGVNGMGAEKGDGIIKLYPRALEPVSHRVEGVSNFEGTLIHEFTHALVNKEMLGKWKEAFEWMLDSNKVNEIKKLGLLEKLKTTSQKDWGSLHPNIWKLARVWEVNQPEWCVTDYAKLGPEDDIAESMVAALKNPKILDGARLRFIKKNFLNETKEKESPVVDIKKRA